MHCRPSYSHLTIATQLSPPGNRGGTGHQGHGGEHRGNRDGGSAGCARHGLEALHDLECVDPGVQLPGVNQAPQDVVVEVAEPQGDPP